MDVNDFKDEYRHKPLHPWEVEMMKNKLKKLDELTEPCGRRCASSGLRFLIDRLIATLQDGK